MGVDIVLQKEQRGMTHVIKLYFTKVILRKYFGTATTGSCLVTAVDGMFFSSETVVDLLTTLVFPVLGFNNWVLMRS